MKPTNIKTRIVQTGTNEWRIQYRQPIHTLWGTHPTAFTSPRLAKVVTTAIEDPTRENLQAAMEVTDAMAQKVLNRIHRR